MTTRYYQFFNPVLYFVDNTGQPLTGGYVYWYRSDDHSTLKNVYKEPPSDENPSGIPWPNPMPLNAAAFQNGNYGVWGADDEPYYVEVRVTNSVSSQLIFSQDNFSPPEAGSGSDTSADTTENLITNGQFFFDYAQTLDAEGNRGFDALPSGDAPGGDLLVAPGPWYFNKNGTGATDKILVVDFIPGQTAVPNNPKAYLNYICEIPATGETAKNFSYHFESVRMFSGETINLQFYAKSSFSEPILVQYIQYFGSGGSSENLVEITDITLTTGWVLYQVVIDVDSINGKVIGTGGDDLFRLVISPANLNSVNNFSLSNFFLRYGDTFLDLQEDSVNKTRAQVVGQEYPIEKDLYTEGYNPEDGYYDVIQGPSGKFYDPKAGKGCDWYKNSDLPVYGLIPNGLPYFQSDKYNLSQVALEESWGTGPDGFTASLVTATITADCFSDGTVVAGSAGTTPFTFTQVSTGSPSTKGQATILVTDASTITPLDYFFINSPDVDYAVYFNLNNVYKSPSDLPALSGKTLVKVVYTGSESANQLAQLITNQLNCAQFRVPDGRGLFFRMPNFGANAVFPVLSQLSLTSSANLSAINYTVNGLDEDGNVISEVRAGPNNNTVSTTAYFSAITSVIPNATNGGGLELGNADDLNGIALSQGSTNGVSLLLNGIWARDIDYATRTALYTGGATGDNVGSFQLDQNLSHSHSVPGHNFQLGGAFAMDGDPSGPTDIRDVNSNGGNQANPKNVYVNKIIFY